MLDSKELISKHLIGRSQSFCKEIDKIPIIAGCDSSVLITGETGTGKEVCVRVIHKLTPQAEKPFVAVNCGAIPPELAENELFGHKHGAFTGASREKPGLIQEAEGGILFLDEIDSLPQVVQVKLLRFLQEKTYRPLGETKEFTANVRVIAAMNNDPEESIRAGKFRQDLYYRLNVLSIELPPLRTRREDIPLLANHFLKKYAQEQGKNLSFSPEALQVFLLYDWPGNVRELEHVVARAVIFAAGRVINEIPQLSEMVGCRVASFKEAKQKVVEEFEKEYIRNLLLVYNGNITRAAVAAGKHRRAFVYLIHKHGIEVERYRNQMVQSPSGNQE